MTFTPGPILIIQFLYARLAKNTKPVRSITIPTRPSQYVPTCISNDPFFSRFTSASSFGGMSIRVASFVVAADENISASAVFCSSVAAGGSGGGRGGGTRAASNSIGEDVG